MILDDRKLDNLRQKIDAIDDQILELLNRRSALVIEVGRLKAANGLPFFVPSRERAI